MEQRNIIESSSSSGGNGEKQEEQPQQQVAAVPLYWISFRSFRWYFVTLVGRFFKGIVDGFMFTPLIELAFILYRKLRKVT